MLQDLRYSVRLIAANHAFACLCVLCLSLAIGSTTTAFTFVNALLLRPIPLAGANQLVELYEARREDPAALHPGSYRNAADWQQATPDVAEIAAVQRVNLRVSDGREPERYPGALVSWNLFRTFGVSPATGRDFVRADELGAVPVVIVSHVLWQQRYGGDPALLGRTITVNGTPRTVVGIMPPALAHFALPGVLQASRVWVPFSLAQHDSPRDDRTFLVYARLRDGVGLAAATSRLKAVAETLATLYPAENEGWTVSVRSLRVGVSSTTRAMLFLAMGAVTFVLLIACANVANLTLARATARRRELATRLALGATAGRIVRQMVTESLLLAVLSVPFGIALACWARRLLLGERVSPDLDRFISIDANVVMFSIGLAFLTSVLSGLVPALHAVGRLQQSVIGEGGSRNAAAGPAHTHLSQALVVVQVSLCLMLLVGASLLIKSFRNALQAEGGFDTSAILAVTVESAEDGARVTESVAASVTAIVERLAAVPGVTHVAAANLMPLRDGGTRGAVVPDAGHVGVDKPPTVLVGGVTGEFFQVLGVPIRLGRSFTDAEGRSPSPVAVVNNTMARRLWPDQNPVGRRFRRVADEDGRWFTVVGVSDDILTWDLSDRPQPTAYLPYAHVAVREPRLLIRADGEPSRLAPSIRTAIHEFDSTLPILDVRTMTEVHYAALARTEMLASLFVALGVIALVLGAAGVYGVLSYFVSHRTQEIGIRAALGADRGALVRLFVRRGMLLTVIGIACGLMGAWALARVVRGRLHDVSASDPTSFTGVTVLLLAVGLVASYLPARRAAHVDPLTAIRE